MSDKSLQLRHFYNAQLAGKFPDVPVADGVNIDELVADDPNPTFLTLPIAEDGRVAEDGLRYTQQFNERLIANTINSRRVLGNMGHMSPFETIYRFDIPAAIWLGAMRTDDGIWWAKAYIVDGDVGNFVRRLKAANGVIATSIHMRYSPLGTTFLDDGTFTVDPDAAELLQLDFAPDERAALKMDRDMLVTSHMNGESEEMPDKKEILASLTVADIAMLPEDVKQAIINEASIDEQLTHFKTAATENAQQLQTLQGTLAERDRELFNMRLDNLIGEAIPTDTADGTLQDYVRTKVVSHLKDGVDLDAAKAKVDEIVNSDIYKSMAKAVVLNMAGGSAIVGARTIETRSAGEIAEKNIDAIEARWGM